jgi:predicted nucleic acid-binding Zn ribbon protein
MAKKKQLSKREKRSLRTRQIVFMIISVIIILSMVLAYVAK